MMLFMGVLFFKVPAGLCLYFISSSIWGICERLLLPKTQPAAAATAAKKETGGGESPKPAVKLGSNGSSRKERAKRRQRKR
jgi:YidC/Oxa1 family membrane protein insertase